MFHYIYQNQFVSSDQELSEDTYPIGSNLADYVKGMYVPLNQEQIEYEESHPNASPEEVWLMHPTDTQIHVKTPMDEIDNYINENHNFFYINNTKYHCYDHQHIIYEAECAKFCQRDKFIIEVEGKCFKGNTDYIIAMMRQICVYYQDLSKAIRKHYNYLEQHPEDIGNYDYTTGFPEVLHFSLEEINDINQE